MNATPYPGPHAVGGAPRHPREALAVEAPANTRRPSLLWSAAHPIDATVAALAWHANQAVTRHVTALYALADLARSQGHAVVAVGERHQPAGPLRAACVTAGRLQIHVADAVARRTLGFGRRFGHLAFAFPRPGAAPEAPVH